MHRLVQALRIADMLTSTAIAAGTTTLVAYAASAVAAALGL
jgi:hypothetical protein